MDTSIRIQRIKFQHFLHRLTLRLLPASIISRLKNFCCLLRRFPGSLRLLPMKNFQLPELLAWKKVKK